MPGPPPGHGRDAARDAGLQLAIAACGSVNELARRLGYGRRRVGQWHRVPADQVLAVARVSGVDAEELRPDLAAWIEREERIRWRARAAERLAALAIGAVPGRAPDLTIEDGLRDLFVVMAAVEFAARERKVGAGRIWVGKKREEESARSYAMGLALVVARAAATSIAGVFDCTRQNVENAGERYLRARDGDDAEDLDAEGRVIERGRLRHAKAGDPALAAAEARFLERLDGAGEAKGRAA